MTPQPLTQAVIGIDPGTRGGMAVVLAMTGDLIDLVAFHRTTPERVAERLRALRKGDAWFERKDGTRVPVCANFAVLEQLQLRSGEGVRSTSTSAVAWGELHGMLIMGGFRILRVQANKWERDLGLPKSGVKKGDDEKTRARKKRAHKQVLRAAAQARWPTLRVTLAVADALHLASYARRHLP